MKLIKRNIFSEQLKREVNLYIGLPEDYYLTEKDYPVLYMQDGHNVFLKEDSFIGETWQMLELYQENKEINDVIVVALDASTKDNGRLYEYSPFVFNLEGSVFNGFGGGGDIYLDYLVKSIKPMIDQEFRTFKDSKNTAIMGSSLGGFISLYAGLKYPNIFGKIASLSGSFFVALDSMIDMIDKSCIECLHTVYLDTGDQEIAGGNSDDYLDSNEKIYENLVKKINHHNVFYRIIKGGKHSEIDWAKRLKSVMLILFGKKNI